MQNNLAVMGTAAALCVVHLRQRLSRLALSKQAEMEHLHLLTDEEIAFYHKHGYVIPKNFRLPEEFISAIKAQHARLIETHPEFVDYCPGLLPYDLGFLNFARHESMMGMAEQLVGNDVILWNSSFFAKPAGIGRKVPWHQDGEYWPIEPLATCTIWIAIDDSTPENGCLRVVPGTHKSKQLLKHQTKNDPKNLALNQELLPTEYKESQAVDIVLKSGQISLHDVYLVHGSEPNRSTKPRRGMTLRLMPSTSLFNRQSPRAKMGHLSKLPLFLMRGNAGENELRLVQ